MIDTSRLLAFGPSRRRIEVVQKKDDRKDDNLSK
jgi:hypothetical protein